MPDNQPENGWMGLEYPPEFPAVVGVVVPAVVPALRKGRYREVTAIFGCYGQVRRYYNRGSKHRVYPAIHGLIGHPSLPVRRLAIQACSF